MRRALLVALLLTSATLAASPQGGRQGGAAPPRGRSVTLGDLTAFDVKDNVITVSAGADRIRIIYYTDGIFRLWLGPDGNFTEAQPNPTDAQIVIYKGAPIAVKSTQMSPVNPVRIKVRAPRCCKSRSRVVE